MTASNAISSGSIVGRYEIVSLLFAGGMGELYHARDPELDRDLVVKLLPRKGIVHPEAVERFIREARASSALNHPNIVTIYEIGDTASGPFIAMELISGRTLRQLRAENPSIQTIARAGSQVARALGVAHAAGIIHRDIKPENLMLREDGYIKILDFGIAQLTSPTMSGEESRITQPGLVVGTMRYMSPEQATGNLVSPASDIFSLGIVLYELAAGRHPFESSSDMATLSAIILRETIPPSRLNSRIPAAFDTLVMRMLSKNPIERPTATEVHEVLDSIVAMQNASRQMINAVASQTCVIGREAELQTLLEAFETARSGRASLICISGEPGIGKTTLTEAFLKNISEASAHSVALGRCSERLAGAEAYLPLLDAIDDLLHDDESGKIAASFHKLAPTWHQMLSGLAGESTDGSNPQSQERMKREFAAFIEDVCGHQPLVLLIEDIHWADVSTVDVLAYLLTRLQNERLLAVATYRPAELQIAQHPFLTLKLDLQTKGAAREIPLSFLTEEYVGRFIADRFPGNQFPPEFTALVHSRTEGSPLFVEDLLRYLKSRGDIAQADGVWRIPGSLPDLESDIPESMRSMVERKVNQLEPRDRALLAAASVQGHSFDSSVVACAVNETATAVEDRLEALDRIHGFVRRAGEREFPNGEVSGRYRFVHVLYQNALYASLAVSRRVALSRAVGEAILDLHEGSPTAVAAELGFLFETARELERAAGYFAVAAEQAIGVFGFDEAMRLAHRGLAALNRLAPNPELKGLELGLQLMLGSASMVMGGYAAPDANAAMERARILAEELGNTPQLSPVYWGLHAYNLVRGDVRKALEVGTRALEIAQTHQGEMALQASHTGIGIALRFMGQFLPAIEHFDKAAAIYDPAKQMEYVAQYHMDTGVFSFSEMGRTFWGAGRINRAIEVIDTALDLAHKNPDPRTVAFAHLMAGVLYHLLREPEEDRRHTEIGIAICDEHQIIQERAWLTTNHGWAIAALGQVDEGIDEMLASLAMRRRLNAILDSPYALIQLADGYIMRGDFEKARATLLESMQIGNDNADLWAMCEVYRLLGDVALLEPARESEEVEVRLNAAEGFYMKAIELAREQGARSFEMRAATSLGRILSDADRAEEALAILEPVRRTFDGERATVDSREADEMIAKLRSLAQREPQPN
jgi:tetratricopeptide (TPR) repeat protein